MDPYSIKRGDFFEFYHISWDINSQSKHILVNVRRWELDLLEVYTQEVQEKFKNHSYSDAIGSPFFKVHPVGIAIWVRKMAIRWSPSSGEILNYNFILPILSFTFCSWTCCACSWTCCAIRNVIITTMKKLMTNIIFARWWNWIERHWPAWTDFNENL